MAANDPRKTGSEDFERLVAAIRTVVAEELAAADVPQLLTANEAMRYVGLSRSGWFRAASGGLLPKPVFVEGSGDRYRRGDLDKFVERLRPRRKHHRGTGDQGRDESTA